MRWDVMNKDSLFGPHSGPMQPFSFRRLVQLIREEFERAPDLRITVSEGARFWALDRATCEQILQELLRVGYLVMGTDARYRQTCAA
jgi:hypothetical protein